MPDSAPPQSSPPDPSPYEPPAYEVPTYDGVIEATHADALPQAIADRVEDLPAADGAAVFERITAERAAAAAEILDPGTAGRIVARMSPEAGAAVISAMPAPEASMVLAEVDPDDRVDILGHVTGAVHDQLMAEFGPDDAAEVRHLEMYPPDTAGGIMTTQVTALAENLTAQQAIEELRRLQEELGQVFYVYVVDGRHHLVGVLTMRDLLLSKPERRLNQFMRTQVASVPATMDQEEVARVMRRLRYLALPVVDNRHRLLGLITVDDVVDVVNEEATEDVQKMFGAGAEERLLSPWQFSFRKRIWWLEVNLATAFLAAWVVSWFDDVVAVVPALAAYMGIVSGMGGNAGAQALAVAVRGMALGETAPRLVWRVLYREAIVGLLAGVCVGLTTWACAALHIFGVDQYKGHAVLFGAVIAIALVFNHVNACTTGVLLPFAMRKMGFDPAQSATIFATTFTDCGGFFATLWLAKVMLHGHVLGL
jgi:magnesium transporter